MAAVAHSRGGAVCNDPEERRGGLLADPTTKVPRAGRDRATLVVNSRKRTRRGADQRAAAIGSSARSLTNARGRGVMVAESTGWPVTKPLSYTGVRTSWLVDSEACHRRVAHHGGYWRERRAMNSCDSCDRAVTLSAGAQEVGSVKRRGVGRDPRTYLSKEKAVRTFSLVTV